jgi:hypothetical protein
MLTGITVFLLFFTHLAGQSLEPVLTYPVYALWLAAWVFVLFKRGEIGGPGILALLTIMASVAINGIDGYFGYRRVFTILGYMGTYYFLQAQRPNLARGLAIAGTLMSLLAVCGVVLGNRNVVSAVILLTIPAALSAWPDHWGRRWYALVAGAVGLVALGSRGAWLAAAVGLIVYSRRWWLLAVAPPLAGLSVYIRPSTVAQRVHVWSLALPNVSLLGRGFGTALYQTLDATQMEFHAHCVPLTVAVEAGLPGLITLAAMGWKLIPRLGRGWQGAALAGLLAWSLVDELIWFWGAGLVAVYLISEVMRDVET